MKMFARFRHQFWMFLMLAVCGVQASQAQVTVSHHTLGSSPDVVRVEVRKEYLHGGTAVHLSVLRNGDSNRHGELNRVEMEISTQTRGARTDIQRHAYSVASRNLLSEVIQENGTHQGSDIYLSIPQPSFVTYQPPAKLWVHANKSTATPTTIKLTVTGHELDCGRNPQRVCGDQDVGRYMVSFDLPLDYSPPKQCGPNNIYTLGPNGEDSRGVPTYAFSKIPRESSDPFAVIPVRIQTGGKPILRPHLIKICIASTISRPVRQTQMYWVKNISTGKCLALPRGPYPQNRAINAQIDTCIFETSVGNQQWNIHTYDDDTWTLEMLGSCINLKASENRNGGAVSWVPCSPHRDQAWRRIGDSVFQLKSASRDKCLTANQNRDYGLVTVTPCSSRREEQRWQLISFDQIQMR
jgi:hypothetical protein